MDKIPLSTHTEDVNGFPVLNAAGEIDLSTASVFKKALSDLIATGQQHILIDMSQVLFMDSSGFGTLLSAIKVLRPAGGSLALVGCNDAVTRMLEITRLNTLFQIYTDKAQAVSEMSGKSHSPQPV